MRANDEKSGKTYTYSYSNGNITEQKEYAYTTGELGEAVDTKTWSYGNSTWSDLLTSYNGEQIVYDEIGNPLTIGNKELSWLGRQLQGITDGDNTYSYTYDENGIRTSKTVNGATTYYNTKYGVILSQTDSTDTWYFQYDSNGVPMGFIRNGVQYFYMTNQMGDVIGINDCTGDSLVIYLYDEWGKVTEICPTLSGTQAEFQYALGEANPLRYRGYYYDNETGYYYLQSRYYDPSICRFINSDIAEISGITKDTEAGTNLFAYCNNDPVNNSDPNGCIAANIISGIIGALVSALTEVVTQALIHFFKNRTMRGFKISTRSLIISVLQGVSSGILMSTKYKKIVQAIGSGIISAFGTIIRNYKTSKLPNLVRNALRDFAFSLILGLLCGNGVGAKFWKKDFKSVLGKGQFVYKNVKLSSGKNGILITSSLKLTKPVIREFAIAFSKYIASSIASCIRTIRKAF